MQRTHYCGELRSDHEGREVTLCGWVHRRRDHGNLIFIDLRDREGIVQVVFNPEVQPAAHQTAQQIRSEFVVQVRGKVLRRPPATENAQLATGQVEVAATGLSVLNPAKNPPFSIEEDVEASESLRFKYRYLDLRRPTAQRAILLRSRLSGIIRRFLDAEGFVEIETPFLTKSTPEGARDYLVPSRVNPGHFYALPQSPQLFKQILMMSGFDRYYQIVRCFRDEDLRADRQPEFTQLDMELSFVEPEDIFGLTERMIAGVFKELKGISLPTPFPRLSYGEAMDRFGTDRPDTRFGMELRDVSHMAQQTDFQVFKKALEAEGRIKGLSVPGGGEWSRKEIEDLTQQALALGAKGLAWIKVTAQGFESPITKFFSPQILQEILEALDGKPGDLMIFVADRAAVGNAVLGELRLRLAEKLNLIPRSDADRYHFLWVVQFPLVQHDPQEQRYVSVNHPFTAPLEEDLSHLDTDPLRIRAKAYDLVLNGVELGGGSIRIHDPALQSRIFKLLGIAPEEAQAKFGFLLDALGYGAPPHGGIAFGLDRLAMILVGANSIREVIAFPKTQKAICLLTDAPSRVSEQQLKELRIKLDLT